MKVVFFRIPKPKQFKYPPRYYDEEEERKAMRRRELGLDGEGSKVDFKSQIAGWKKFRKSDSRRQKKAQMTVVVYLMIVAMLIYLIFFS